MELVDLYMPTHESLLEKEDQLGRTVKNYQHISNGESELEKGVKGWFSSRDKRTRDFVERFVRKEFRNGLYWPVSNIIKAPERTFRRRKHPRAKRSHIRNYRPETPYRVGAHYLLYPSRLGCVELFLGFREEDGINGDMRWIQKNGREYLKVSYGDEIQIYLPQGNKFILVDRRTLKPLSNSGIQAIVDYESNPALIPRYSRKFSNEEPQTMPKIPYREIGSHRALSHGRSRRQYMNLNEQQNAEIGFRNNGEPRKISGQDKARVWTYHSPKGNIGKINLAYQGEMRPCVPKSPD
ncbi:hypothetical protein HYS31_06400 [Candidatus Woesearchaeota archaeon]|nr:hypothetical protein [Candidatus Woesearchaeota archaeon]